MNLLKKSDQAVKLEDNLLQLDLQFYAENDVPPGDNPPEDTPLNDSPTVDKPEDTPPAKTFTQEDVNNLVAKEAKKAQEKLLKQLGVEDFNNAKEGLTKFKEWQESQKTEAEKQAERLKELEANYSNTSNENAILKAQISAMKAGVLAESVEDVVTLAKTMVSDDLDMDAAIAKVVEKYPHFAQKQEKVDEPKPSFSLGKHEKQPSSEMDAWLEAFGVKKQ
ncbi:Uncharacterised protein [Niallia circulans]|uniref:hypothetical protein n=1 Tax=Niallia circulans TaxID=1397 RepID=UPI00077C9B20|nr:hypothetical protein [Niallia circulans]MED3841674.1 hypothetical protein [Niallia circulans]MED4243410.1 hypothetical protein [Niallia circulans]MED4248285.1 hypothetical protein [Niallia circulans]SPT86127.1 Uncharacterised protein [Niallia circulans]